jgi:hypothetical protein
VRDTYRLHHRPQQSPTLALGNTYAMQIRTLAAVCGDSVAEAFREAATTFADIQVATPGYEYDFVDREFNYHGRCWLPSAGSYEQTTQLCAAM